MILIIIMMVMIVMMVMMVMMVMIVIMVMMVMMLIFKVVMTDVGNGNNMMMKTMTTKNLAKKAVGRSKSRK